MLRLMVGCCRLLSPGGTGCSRHPTTSRTSRLCVRHWCLQKHTKDKSQTFRCLFPLSCQNSNRILMTPLKRFSQLVHPYGKFLSERKSFIAVCSILLACFWCISYNFFLLYFDILLICFKINFNNKVWFYFG